MISLIKILPSFAVFFICFVLPSILFAQEVQEYVPIVTIPGVNENQNTSTGFNSYVNALYIFAITAGALLAVLKLVGAGVKYMFSDIVTTKMDAIKDIKGALLGLLLIIGAVVILNTVNTDLTNVNLNVNTLDNLPSGDIDFRIISIITYCNEHPGCYVSRSFSEEECNNLGGVFIDRWGPINACMIMPPETCTPIPPMEFDCTSESCTCYGPPDTQCADDEILSCDYRNNCQCIPGTTTEHFFEVAEEDQIDARIAELEGTPGYTRMRSGDSGVFEKNDETLEQARSHCALNGGNHFEIFDWGANYFLTCWRYETPS